mmetsp:Transcript_40717/g.97681  ORF Transcript_40717/g.97681 Transcript_40717/m.97681 type:complete len:164 (+) Transcript_40717:486-977(+)
MELVHLDDLPHEIDVGLGQIEFEYMQHCIDHPDVSPQLKTLYHTIKNRHGYRLGLKRKFVDGGRGKAFEFTMHQPSVTETGNALTEEIKDASIAIIKDVTGFDDITVLDCLEFLSSWATWFQENSLYPSVKSAVIHFDIEVLRRLSQKILTSLPYPTCQQVSI